ncbi:MAG: glycosyltransferase family 4 protein [bacterium]|nr:glycosyltransferase family 4 protein [bacterium]
MKKVKVCYVINDLSIGGAPKVLYSILKDIDYEIFEVSIIVLSSNLELLDNYNIHESIDIYEFEYLFDSDYSLRRYLQLCFSPRLTEGRASEIIECIVKIAPDILHFHTQPRELMIGIIAHKKHSMELVYTDHTMRINPADSTYIKRNLLALSYKTLFRHYHVISVSKSVQEYHKRYFLLNTKKHNHMFENRIDIPESYPDKKDSAITNVIYVSRLAEKKGHNTLLKSWGLLNDNKAKLTIVGDGPLRDQLEEIAKSKYGSLNIVFTGMVNDVRSYLLNSQIAVFPSEKEGLPLALLEKMAAGLPVIVSDIPELTDIISDGISGFHFENNNPMDLSKKLGILIQDKNLRELLAKQGFAEVKSRFGEVSLSQLASDHYLRILNIST